MVPAPCDCKTYPGAPFMSQIEAQSVKRQIGAAVWEAGAVPVWGWDWSWVWLCWVVMAGLPELSPPPPGVAGAMSPGRAMQDQVNRAGRPAGDVASGATPAAGRGQGSGWGQGSEDQIEAQSLIGRAGAPGCWPGAVDCCCCCGWVCCCWVDIPKLRKRPSGEGTAALRVAQEPRRDKVCHGTVILYHAGLCPFRAGPVSGPGPAPGPRRQRANFLNFGRLGCSAAAPRRSSLSSS